MGHLVHGVIERREVVREGREAVRDLVQQELVFPRTWLEELRGGRGQQRVSGVEPAHVWWGMGRGWGRRSKEQRG